MKKIWELIELKLKEIAPDILNDLNSGVSDEEIADLEKTINVKLPDDVIAFYKVHNGQKGDSGGFFRCEEWLSFERIKGEWGIWKGLLDSGTFQEEDEAFYSDPDYGIKEDWWNASWIPITYDGAGNHYCIDLDPAEGGISGQIIRMWHDSDERTLEANSFTEWVTKYKDDLINGKLIYSEEFYGITYNDDDSYDYDDEDSDEDANDDDR